MIKTILFKGTAFHFITLDVYLIKSFEINSENLVLL